MHPDTDHIMNLMAVFSTFVNWYFCNNEREKSDRAKYSFKFKLLNVIASGLLTCTQIHPEVTLSSSFYSDFIHNAYHILTLLAPRSPGLEFYWGPKSSVHGQQTDGRDCSSPAQFIFPEKEKSVNLPRNKE